MRAVLTGIVIGLLLGAVPAAVHYQGQLEEAKARIAELERAKSSLEQENKALRQENQELRSQIDEAGNTIRELQAQVARLQDQIRNLTSQLENKTVMIQELEEEKRQLQEEVNSLNEQISELEAQLYTLNYTLETLNQSIKEMLEWYSYNSGGVYTDYILEEAPETVRDEAAYLLHGIDDTSVRVLKVWKYILLSTMYAYDSYIRVYDGNRIVILDHYVMLPNETLLLGQGDCDDLALLAYAMLVAEQLDTEKVYLVVWTPIVGPGHAAVIVATPQGYYIVDPAGNYLNGWGLYLEMKIEDYTSESNAWYYYFNPLSMWNTTKQRLLENSFATLNYYNYLTDRDYYRLASVDPVQDAFTALYQWISEYWDVNIESIEFYAPGIHVEFTSVADAADWLEANT